MTRNTTPGEAVRAAIDRIRRITSENNVDDFSNDELLETCIELVQADESRHKADNSRRLHGNGAFLAVLDAARYRADSYDEDERATITRAIERANRSLATR